MKTMERERRQSRSADYSKKASAHRTETNHTSRTRTNGKRTQSRSNIASPKTHTTKSCKAAHSKSKKYGSFIPKALMMLICMAMIGGIFGMVDKKISSPSVVYADEHLSELQYKVIEINYGDTLWSIARDNMTPGYDDINDYINEIKECNQLSSDEIQSGCYLMIPYYEYIAGDTVIASNN